jgi:hypothetical protein
MKGCLLAVLGIPAALVIIAIAIFWLNFYDVHVRYRLSVEVQDGDQIKTGSSVIEASYSVQPDWSPSGPRAYDPRIVGYAPTVDLGDKGILFLTFNERPTPLYVQERSKQVPCKFRVAGCVPFAAYNKSGVWSSATEESARLRELLRQSGAREVPFAMLPEIVRFRNTNDPQTREPVSPYDLAMSFGPSVQLRHVTLQLTDDPVTPAPDIWPQWMTVKGQNDTTDLRGYENLGYSTIYGRYRLTVEVMDGDQIRTGSSLIGIPYITMRSVAPEPVPMPIGNAPTIDLGEKGLLFLTFTDSPRTPAQRIDRDEELSCPFNDIGCLPLVAYYKPGTAIGIAPSQKRAALGDMLLHERGPHEIPFAMLPELVRFRDINDPQTREPVSPYDLAGSFGPGVQLKRVMLQLTTDDPVAPPPEIWPQWMKAKRQNTEFKGYGMD